MCFCKFLALVPFDPVITPFSSVETSWKPAGRVYTDSSKYTSCERQPVSCWRFSGRTDLQGTFASHFLVMCLASTWKKPTGRESD